MGYLRRKLILLGEVNSNVKMVTVLDTSKFEAIESFFAFEPMLSPSGRYVAFSKVLPEIWCGRAKDRALFDI